MSMNKDENEKALRDALLNTIIPTNPQDQIKNLMDELIHKHFTDWQTHLVEELLKLAGKLSDMRTEYITGLRDAVDIVNGSVDMDPIGNINIFTDPATLSTEEIQQAVKDAENGR